MSNYTNNKYFKELQEAKEHQHKINVRGFDGFNVLLFAIFVVIFLFVFVF